MLKDVDWSPDGTYASDLEYKPARFFSEALANSQTFDLFLGFFSSSAITVLADAFAIFLGLGGRMRLIVNVFLSEEDKEAFKGDQSTFYKGAFDINNLKALKDSLSKRDMHFFECLSWLIAENRIEIKVVAPKSGRGISHPKSGIFSDGHDEVAFGGSCNFTANALVNNIEHLSTSCSWNGDIFKARIKTLKDNFEEVFSGNSENYEIIPLENLARAISENFPKRSLEQLLEDENHLQKEFDEQAFPDGSHDIEGQLQNVRNKLMELIKEEKSKPHFPIITGPKDYQKEAYKKWLENGRKGLFAMATGTGKTFTALNILLEESRLNNGEYRALILVPTVELAKQWEEECRKFNFRNVYLFSGSIDLKKRISTILQYEKEHLSDISYIFICTYASYQRIDNFDLLNRLAPDKIILIADEAHNLGARNILSKLESVSSEQRIGLSATPERPFEEETNQKVLNFFNAGEKPTFEFGMDKAIKEGILCRYYYFPHVVRLTEKEMEEYRELTEKIIKVSRFTKQDQKDPDNILRTLLLKRKKIINKAANKFQAFSQIIKDIYKEKGQLKNCLVYVPEGLEEEAEDNKRIIDDFTLAIRGLDDHITVCQFTARTEERKKLLQDFAKGNVDVLTSMKCLDEGIDVPAAKTAIICASSENPRQYIQRRGRVLRQYNGQFANIHDIVVLPPLISQDKKEREMEKRLIEKELRRTRAFSRLAQNSAHFFEIFFPILEEYKIPLRSLM